MTATARCTRRAADDASDHRRVERFDSISRVVGGAGRVRALCPVVLTAHAVRFIIAMG